MPLAHRGFKVAVDRVACVEEAHPGRDFHAQPEGQLARHALVVVVPARSRCVAGATNSNKLRACATRHALANTTDRQLGICR